MNKAEKGGSIHSYENIPNSIKSNTFYKNDALYGSDYSSFPVSLGLLQYSENGSEIIIACRNDSDKSCNIDNFASGQKFPNFTLCLIDTYGQKISLLDGYAFIDLHLDPNLNNTHLKGAKYSAIKNGTTIFDAVNIIGYPNSSLLLKFTTNLIPVFQNNFLHENFFHHHDENMQYFFLLKAHLRLCNQGEIYDPLENICVFCPKGTYSLNSLSNKCKDCPYNVECEYGGDFLDIHVGYWRSNIYSDTIYHCNTASNPCLGGYNSTCNYGHRGIKCSSCILDGDLKFFRKGLYMCEECGKSWMYIVIVFLVLIFIFRIIFLLESDAKQDKLNFILIKIITTHFQTLNMIPVINIDLPDINFINVIFSFELPFTTADSVFSIFECIDIGSMSIYFVKMMGYLIFAVMLLMVILIFQFLVARTRKLNFKIMRIKILTTLVIALNFFQPWLINFYMQNITCEEYEGESYLSFNMDQKCWVSTHLIISFIVTIPILIFLMVVYPLVLIKFEFF